GVQTCALPISASPFAGGSNPFAAAGSNPFASAPAAASPFGAAPSNPFGAPARSAGRHAVAHNAAPGTYTYEMLKSGPSPTSDEVETMAAAVEVMISWG